MKCEQPSAGRTFWEGRRAGAEFLGRMRPDGFEEDKGRWQDVQLKACSQELPG